MAVDGELTYTQQFPNVSSHTSNSAVYCFNVRVTPKETGKANVYLQFTSAGNFDWWVGVGPCPIEMYKNGVLINSNCRIGGMEDCNMPGSGMNGVLNSPTTLYYKDLVIERGDKFRFTVDCSSVPLISNSWTPGLLDTGDLSTDTLFPNVTLIEKPVLGSIKNTNPYTNPSNNTVENGVSKSTDSISLSWSLSDGDAPTRMRYRTDGGRWVEISTMYRCTVSNLNPGTSYKIEVQGSNEAGDSNILSIIVRTRNAPPVVALRVSSINLEQMTFIWNSNKDLAKAFFSIDDGNFTEVSGVSGKLGTFTARWFSPNTEHTIKFYGISTAALDYLTSSTVSVSGTTLDRSRIKPVIMQPFGCEITLGFTCESSYSLKLKITVTGKEGRSATFSYDDIQRTAENVNYTWRPTQAELDSIYRCYTDTNKVTMDFCLTTHGEWKDWDDTSNGHDLVLTGIAKTAHIGVNKIPKRGQCFIGIDSVPKRAVTWIGINGVPKRGI